MNLAFIPPQTGFLDAIASAWLTRHPQSLASGGTLAHGLILLPTRRAARALATAFLRANAGRPLLLPRITALGALDEAPLTLAGGLDLPPAVEPAQRLAALSRLIMAVPPSRGGVAMADRAWMLARELANLMDEAERAEIDLHDALRHAAAAEHAQHWQTTLDFLAIVTEAWPAWLADQGMMNPATRQVALLTAQAEAWAAAPPDHPIWAVGMTGGIAAVARLLRVVAGLPQGEVVLPGLDLDLPDATWELLEPTHPQAGLRDLLAGLGARRSDVRRWPITDANHARDQGTAARAALLSHALLPAGALADWRTSPPPQLDGLWRLAAADQQEEATAIAMVLRDALQTPGARAALVTPDRALAGRVTAELLRWGVLADDSAGETLADSPPAVFLRLLAATIADALGPVSLLALLKHPFAAAGLAPVACRAAARALEKAALRGPRPPPGIAGLRKAAENAPDIARNLLTRVQTCLEPALRLTGLAMPPAAMLTALVEAAEALAGTDETAGPAILWAHEEGEALATLLATSLAALTLLPDQPPSVLPGLLDVLLEGEVVRSRRALRGRNAAGEHPRVFIWGLLEARLQTVDVVVLGGLVEGVWPPATDPGPWLSRPMRSSAGLASPEVAIGQAAHDFVAVACAAPVAVLSCPHRRDGAPAVPARWLARLDAFLGGHATALPHHPAAGWAARLDLPIVARRLAPPTPRPAVALRPRRLSVTEIETWLADPYAIYARHVLRLRPLDPLEQATDAADFGRLVHAGLHRFLAGAGANWPTNAAARLRAAMDFVLADAGLRRALLEWWRPRLHRIADWVAETELVRRDSPRPVRIESEVSGVWDIDVPGGFRLTGRADRIELRDDGTLAILDYKTGTPPSQKDIADGFAPQLPLEAAMAAAGAFPGLSGQVADLAYWQLSGGYAAGRAQLLFKGDRAAIGQAACLADASLRALVRTFDMPGQPYLSQPHATRVPRFAQYAQLARVAEWDQSDEDAAEDEA